MTLSFDPDHLTFDAVHWIGGTAVAGPGALAVSRPSDGASLGAVPCAGADLVDRAVQTAHRVWHESGWGRVRPRDRVRVLHKWADLVETHAQDLGQIEVVPSTRLIREVITGDVAISAEQIRFFAEFADKEGGALAPTGAESLGFVQPEPYGVIGAITPWNYPLSMAVWKLAPALAAGNAVVLKPSEMTPFSVLRLVALAEEAGVPRGLINVVQGDGPGTGAALVAHPLVGKVSFTGSTRAGAAIQANLAQTGLKPVTLELGGKSPQVVFADADVPLALDCVARGFLPNAGQTCVAGTRLIVHERLAERMIDGLLAQMALRTPGPAWEETTNYSPLVSETQLSRVTSIVDRARGAGADVLTGGTRMDVPGFFYTPTLLGGLAPDNPALREEIFGPVLTVQTFTDDAEAIEMANASEYGLCAGVYSRDLSRAMTAARGLQAGTVWVNRYGRSRDHILPTGGYKASGLGKDLGREAYLGALKMKSVLVDL